MMTRRNLALGAAFASLTAAAPRLAAAQEDWDDPKFWPNVFISPFGQPFRAKPSDPYPVVVWFKQADKNNDGKIDKAEFLADAAYFFDALDVNRDGILEPIEVQRYEYRIAPEILGYRVNVSRADGRRIPGLSGGRLWLAQGGGPEAGGVMGALPPGAAPDPSEAQKVPHSIDESHNGASPFSFFDQPEPITAADLDFNGLIKKKNFLRLAGVHFQTLDHKDLGYLTLAGLPKTHAQEVLERTKRR